MILRRSIVGAALVSVCALSPSVVAGGGTVIGGDALGAWNLPLLVLDGHINGYLYFGHTNTAAYHFTAVLHNVPQAGVNDEAGSIVGSLDDGVGPGPDYLVRGRYLGDLLTGSGIWRAQILTTNGGPINNPVQVGRMNGTYDDSPSLPPSVGTFAGQWALVQ